MIINLNWQKIEKKYPKYYEEFSKFNGDGYSHGVKYVLNDLLDFFWSKDLKITIEMSLFYRHFIYQKNEYSGYFRGYFVKIFYKDCIYKISKDKLKDKKEYYQDYWQAWKKGIMKAFKILEKELNNER